MATFIMVRTVCCQSYKWCGERCSICPDRPENCEAVRNFERELEQISLGNGLVSILDPAPRNPVPRPKPRTARRKKSPVRQPAA
ncbi:MAG: hypothetical protein FJW20_04495 [Acidimicrobiia bacterium]|nr:hypothetical protein [Acidimicrobiia bacterium]